MTTRWQWLNSLFFAQCNFFEHLPQLKKVEKPIYIVGIGRSGTTILGALEGLFLETMQMLNYPVERKS